MFRYTSFGYTFLSDLALPLHNATNQDTEITIQKNNGALSAPLLKSNYCFYEDAFYLRIESIGQFFIQKNKILYYLFCQDSDSIIPFILYTAIPICLTLGGELVLRGSALNLNNDVAECWLSHSGGGNSTLYAYALQNSAKSIGDHLCVIKKIGDHFVVMPGYPVIKLWLDACEKLSISHTTLKPVRANLKQYWYSIKKEQITSPSMIYRLVSFTQCNLTPTPNCKLLKGLEKLQVLMESVWFSALFNSTNILKNQKKMLIALANSTTVEQIKFSKSITKISAVFEKLAEKNLASIQP